MAGLWFSQGTPVSSNKTDHHGITEILLKVALNSITLTPYLALGLCLHIFFFAFLVGPLFGQYYSDIVVVSFTGGGY